MINNINRSIIPEPAIIIPKEGFFQLNKDTIIYFAKNVLQLAEFFRDLIKPATGFDLILKKIPQKENLVNCIILKLSNNSHIEKEGYNLYIFPDKIEIESITPTGLLYGIQTLRQLFPPEIDSPEKTDTSWKAPCLEIKDFPRFSWRGFMLDEARHFFGKEIVKKILDLMAYLKLNMFHWHLTDYQGWRIEIKKYPLLTEIGSKRKSTNLYLFRKKSDGIPYSGYYTQNDIREIVNYAQQRGITIIPEIEMPGHSIAMIAAYPELSCEGIPLEVSTRIGVFPEVLCIGKNSTFKFIEDILTEIIKIFPSKIIHTGNDEVPTKKWKKCKNCQRKMKDEDLENERELHLYFINRIAKFLEENGTQTIVWNDILDKSLNNSIICQFWSENFDQVLKHAKMGRNIIMSEIESVYFDHTHKRTSLSKSYDYKPVPENLECEYHNNVLGLEACLWTELINDVKTLEHHIFPRLIAIAETGWTLKEKKNFESFRERLTKFVDRLDFLNMNYAPQNEWF